MAGITRSTLLAGPTRADSTERMANSNQSMATYLVTGGAGFIGSHLVEELLRRGHHVRIVDNLSSGTRANVDAAVASARASGVPSAEVPTVAHPPELIEGDLSDLEVARQAVEGAEYVLHQAAMPSVPRSVEDPISANRANITATLNVLLAARDARVKRVVFAGSSSVYGDQPELPKHERMSTQPLSPYALQKLVGEQYLQLFSRLYGLDTVTIRYFNVFGPRQDPSSAYSGVISLFIKAVTEQRTPTMHGDGEQTRDFTYVANVVDAVLRAAETPNLSGEIINVATGTRVSLNQLLETLNQLAGTHLEAVHGPVRVGDVRDSLADISKATELLGYRPFVPFEEGLRRTWEWAQGR